MKALKFYLRRARDSRYPIKYSILAYIMVNGASTVRQIAKSLHLKHTTVRSYLNKLFHEAEVGCADYDDNGEYSKEKYYYLELEWNEQASILSGLFMTQKDYNDFKKTDAFKENEKLLKETLMPLVYRQRIVKK